MSTHRPAETFPARDFIDEELAARGWSWEDFATILGYPLAEVELYLSSLVYPDAFPLALALALGTTRDLWLGLLDAEKGARGDG